MYEGTRPAAEKIVSGEKATNSDGWREDIELNDAVAATTEQTFLFGDNLETSAWEWSRFLNFSPADDHSPLDNGS